MVYFFILFVIFFKKTLTTRGQSLNNPPYPPFERRGELYGGIQSLINYTYAKIYISSFL
jgi:hypothetical protein